MTTVNLDNLSVEDLNKLKLNIDSTIINKRQSEILALRQQVESLVDNSPFTLQEIMEAKQARKPVFPKYKNPNDPEQTWTGRGRRPHWVENCLANGMDLTDILI